MGDISWIAFALTVVVSTVLGGLWFAVAVAKPYAVALGRVGRPAPETALVSVLGPLACTVATTLTTAVLLEALGVTTTQDAIAFGLVVGVGYLSAMALQVAINPNVPRPLLYGAINAPYFIATSVIGAAVMTAMR